MEYMRYEKPKKVNMTIEKSRHTLFDGTHTLDSV